MARGHDEMDQLLLGLKDPDWEARFKAAEGLGRLKRARAVKPLIEALKDEDEYVREGAVWALGEIGHKMAVEPLIEALKDPDRYVREGAISALGKIKDKGAVKPLIGALKDRDESVRRAAEAALGSLGEMVLSDLVGLLGDDDWDVRWRVTHIMGEIRDCSVFNALCGALKDENKYVREGAVAA